ncbi:hypothetical protein AB1Y20_006970 [Prymnesium parvum]|uniref:Bifunctional lysine-specific demethylase and histidyl-hydroxylase n=1 Tax=Prymnesium parvum TaxID=97485 RepID=A0AB34IZ30_PRYPA
MLLALLAPFPSFPSPPPSPHSASSLSPGCESFCSDACANLNGDIASECGGCPSTAACRPGAHGFPSALPQTSPSLPPSSTSTSAAPPSPLPFSPAPPLPPAAPLPFSSSGGGVHQAGACHDDPSEAAASAAFAALASLPEPAFWRAIGGAAASCAAPDDLSRLAARGYAVVRGVLPAEEAARLALPAIDGPSEPPGRLASASFPRERMPAPLLASLEARLHEWRRRQLLPPAQAAAPLRVGGFKFIRTAPARCAGACVGRWHIDPSAGCPRDSQLSLMLRRDANLSHANVVVAPESGLRALLAAALAANASGGGGALRDGEAEELTARAYASATSGSRAEQGGALPRREVALERVACTVVLQPGDLLYFAGIYHRTQDSAAARVTLHATAGPAVNSG